MQFVCNLVTPLTRTQFCDWGDNDKDKLNNVMSKIDVCTLCETPHDHCQDEGCYCICDTEELCEPNCSLRNKQSFCNKMPDGSGWFRFVIDPIWKRR